MKNIILTCLVVLFGTALFFAGCKKSERSINLNLTEVPGLFAPADNTYIKLKPATNQTVVFEWDQAKAEDGSLVLYEVAFDQADGDFSKPFYTVVSDNRGVDNKLTVTHGDLSKIAALGGANFFERKKFKWTVLSSKGTNVKKAAVSNIIDLERPGGFAVLPGTLYITGTATEGGAALSGALQMLQVSSGVFEIFTKLTAGTYQFVDGKTGTPAKYYVYNDNGINAIGVDSVTTFTGPDKIERIVLDFNNINATYAEVKSVQLWYCFGNAFWFTLPYTSNGEWRYDGFSVVLQVAPWGALEERYKYKMVIDQGSGDEDLWLNSNFNDPPGQDGQYPSTIDYRTINLTQNDGSQFNWSWKFDRPYIQNQVVDFWVSLRGSDGVYTQNYIKH